MQPSVFLSGGMRSGWQTTVITRCGNRFRFYDPSNHKLNDPRAYTAWDIHHVKACDIVFAYMESTNPSGYGLAFELGLAYALGKTIILVDEKSIYDPNFKRYFQILYQPSGIVFNNLEEGINYLLSF